MNFEDKNKLLNLMSIINLILKYILILLFKL